MDNPDFTSPLQLMLLRNLPDMAVLVFDADLRYHLAEGTELENWPEETGGIIGQTLGAVFPTDHQALLEPLYRRVFAGETVLEECQLYDLTYHVRLFPLAEAGEAIQFGAAIYQNMTVQAELVGVLHNQEYRYERLFEQTNDAIFILDTEGRHVEVNQRALEMFGYSLTEMIGMKYNQLVATNDLDQSTGILHGMLGGQVYPVYERTFIKKDGTSLIAEVNTALVQAHEGSPMYIQSVVRDITARKLTEARLRESEQRYRILTEVISDFAYAFRVDENGKRVMEWITEDSYQRITGYRSEETHPQGSSLLWHPDDVPQIRADRNRVLAGEAVTDEYRLVTKQGEIRWMRVYRRPVWDEQQQRVVRFYGIAQDVTERRLAEDALRESEERYRSLTELISDYAFAFRVTEDLTMELEWVTAEPFRRLTGYSEAETRQLKPTSLYHPDEHEHVTKDFQIVVLGKPVTGDYRIITKDGQERWLQIHRRPVWDKQRQRVIRFYGVAQDITERRQAEDALRASEERYRNLTELISDYAFSVYVHPNTETEMDWITGESFRRLTGYNETETRQLNQGALFHPDDRDQVQADIRTVIAGEAVTGEYRIITKDGQERWLQIHRRPVWDKKEQRVTHFYGIAQDITKRKLAENALRESEERYRTITELISDYAFSATVEGESRNIHFEWITEDSLKRITGYSVDEFVNTSIAHPEDVRRLLQEVQAAAQGQTNNSVFRIITKWGDTRWLRLDRYPVWDKDYKQVLRFYGIAHDITEIKQAEDAQKRSEERFRLISQSTLDGLYDIDLLGDQTWLNDGYQRLLKLSSFPENMLDWWLERIHPDDRAGIEHKLDRLITGNLSHWAAEYRMYDTQGRMLYIRDRGHIIPDETGRAERLIGAVTDVTQQREIEQRRLDITVEREKLKIFTDFITAISHDFRNPLSILNTSIYLLEKVDNPEDRQRHLAKLKYETAHIEMLVDGLLTMSQLDSPEAFQFHGLNVNDLLYYVEVREQNSFTEQRLTLRVLPGDDLPRVHADLNWLYRALRNLIANARLYTPEGGEVTVMTYAEDDEVVIAVEDNGIGIAPEHLTQIFDPLYRVQSHRPSSGQGLGLSIARKIVERHSGMITVESVPDAGSTFRIHLPVLLTEPDIRLD